MCGALGNCDLETFSWQEPLFSCSYFQTQKAVYHLVEQNLPKICAIAWIEVQGGFPVSTTVFSPGNKMTRLEARPPRRKRIFLHGFNVQNLPNLKASAFGFPKNC